MVTGAVQDLDAGIIVGPSKTYGKGMCGGKIDEPSSPFPIPILQLQQQQLLLLLLLLHHAIITHSSCSY